MAGRKVVDWGEVSEGILSVFYAVAKATKEMYSDTREIVVKFRYTPANTDEEAVFHLPKHWGDREINEFLDALWAMMTIY